MKLLSTIYVDNEDFQNFNVNATNENRRVSNLNLLKDAFIAFIKNPSLKNWGLNNLLALKQILHIIISSIFINKERLRLAQFVMKGKKQAIVATMLPFHCSHVSGSAQLRLLHHEVWHQGFGAVAESDRSVCTWSSTTGIRRAAGTRRRRCSRVSTATGL